MYSPLYMLHELTRKTLNALNVTVILCPGTKCYIRVGRQPVLQDGDLINSTRSYARIKTE